MDTWCQQNCPGNCPASHCICDGTAAPTTTGAPLTTTAQDPTTPQNNPTPQPDVDDEVIKGYYAWSWNSPMAVGPADTNLGVYFNGWSNVDNALAEMNANNINDTTLQGVKYFSFGGGNHNGVINADNLQVLINDLSKLTAAGFEGVMFDVEKVRGSAASLNPVFASAFAAVKAAGMKVAITVSHTAPYDCDTPQDAVDFVRAFVADTNVDIISPQLYTSGHEAAADYAVTGSCAAAGCDWSLYQDMHAGMKFVPSLANRNQYTSVKNHFSQMGITCKGYIQWQQGSRRLDTLIV